MSSTSESTAAARCWSGVYIATSSLLKKQNAQNAQPAIFNTCTGNVWQHLFSSMAARQAACCILFSGQDKSLLLIWMKLVVPTATANDNTATASLTTAQLLHGINGCKYLNFVMPEALNVMQLSGVDGCSWLMPAIPLVLGRCFYCPEQEGPEWKDQRELRGKWIAAAECTWEWNHPELSF